MPKKSFSQQVVAAQFDVLCGIDVARETHHAVALAHDAAAWQIIRCPTPSPLWSSSSTSSKAMVGPLVVVDQLASIGALAIAVARSRGITVAYLPGLAMRRIADLHPGDAKTDARDAHVIADAARTLPHALRRIAHDERTTVELAVLPATTPTWPPSPRG